MISSSCKILIYHQYKKILLMNMFIYHFYYIFIILKYNSFIKLINYIIFNFLELLNNNKENLKFN